MAVVPYLKISKGWGFRSILDTWCPLLIASAVSVYTQITPLMNCAFKQSQAKRELKVAQTVERWTLDALG